VSSLETVTRSRHDQGGGGGGGGEEAGREPSSRRSVEGENKRIDRIILEEICERGRSTSSSTYSNAILQL
jgi:hypothetical protein